MQPRIDLKKVAPAALKAMFGLEQHLRSRGLEEKLLLLIHLRVSQINGCAYCLDMHSKDLRATGESEQRLYLLDAWHESPFYSNRERAALAWLKPLRWSLIIMCPMRFTNKHAAILANQNWSISH